MEGSKRNQVKPLRQSNTSIRWSSPSPGIAIAALRRQGARRLYSGPTGCRLRAISKRSK